MSGYDVIIVGAGISGLVSAYELCKNGVSVLVLEASSRVGGRTYSVTTTVDGIDVVADLGGQWIYEDGQQKIAELTKELQIPTTLQYHKGTKILEYDDGTISTYSGSIPSLPFLSLLDFQFNLLNKVDSLAKTVPLDSPFKAPNASKWDGMTVESFKDSYLWTKGSKMFADLFIRPVFGAEARDLSFLYFLQYVNSGGGVLKLAEIEKGAQETKFVGGSNQITWKLKERIESLGGKVFLDHPVISLSQNELVNVVTKHGKSFTSKYVILAIPPTQCQKMEFTPSMPYDREQLGQRLFMGCYIKCLVFYKTAFWRDSGYSGEISSANVNYEEYPISVGFDACIKQNEELIPALVCFICGKASAWWSKQSEQQRKTAILSHLSKFFGDVALNPTKYIEKDWNTDEWARGCPVNHFSTGTLELCNDALREPVGRIHFAGTETALKWRGYMDGATESGQRAATEVYSKLQKTEV